MFGAVVRFSRTLLIAASLGIGSAGAWAYSHKTADLTGIPPTEEELYDALIPPDDGLTRGISVVARKADITVQFEFDSYLLTAGGRTVLDTLGAVIGSERGQKFNFRLEGHTDSTGSAAYNMRLSRLRAQSVKDYLISEFPIDPAKLSTIGMGETRPMDRTPPEDPINRRVTVVNQGE